MISLILSWLAFGFFISLLPELTQSQYFLYSCCMLSLSCAYNSIYFVNISKKTVVLIAIIPNVLLLYIAVVYNDFLSFTPMKHQTLLSLFFLFIYLFYIISNKSQQTNHLSKINYINTNRKSIFIKFTNLIFAFH